MASAPPSSSSATTGSPSRWATASARALASSPGRSTGRTPVSSGPAGSVSAERGQRSRSSGSSWSRAAASEPGTYQTTGRDISEASRAMAQSSSTRSMPAPGAVRTDALGELQDRELGQQRRETNSQPTSRRLETDGGAAAGRHADQSTCACAKADGNACACAEADGNACVSAEADGSACAEADGSACASAEDHGGGGGSAETDG